MAQLPALLSRASKPLLIEARMSQPVTAPPEHPRRAPSITRVFTAAFLAIAVAVLADRYVTWQSARRTQADMVELTHRLEQLERLHPDRKSTRLNSSHGYISYAVFCLKKKKKTQSCTNNNKLQ